MPWLSTRQAVVGLTLDDWKAALVQRSLSNDWPVNPQDLHALKRGPCLSCGAMMHRLKGEAADMEDHRPMATVSYWACLCGANQAVGVANQLLQTEPCPRCQTLVGYDWTPIGRPGIPSCDGVSKAYRIKCKCGYMVTAI